MGAEDYSKIHCIMSSSTCFQHSFPFIFLSSFQLLKIFRSSFVFLFWSLQALCSYFVPLFRSSDFSVPTSFLFLDSGAFRQQDNKFNDWFSKIVGLDCFDRSQVSEGCRKVRAGFWTNQADGSDRNLHQLWIKAYAQAHKKLIIISY